MKCLFVSAGMLYGGAERVTSILVNEWAKNDCETRILVTRTEKISKYPLAQNVEVVSCYEDIKKAVKKYTVFGRVNPEQKKQIIKALKELGLKVAMTGDGVNDVLALKDSDCSIAMASGSDAARRTAQLVLTDSNFKSMPNVVKEGRRVINNIEKSASLFLVKTIY